MRWSKRGLIYAPDGSRWWARSYATIPTAEVRDDVIRVFFAALDEQQFGRIGYVDLDPDKPERILAESPEPVLDVGVVGTFDDCGVNPSCVVSVNGDTYLYYIGWQRAARVPYLLFAGLAISRDGGTFTKVAPIPVLDRTASEPFLRSATSIIVEPNTFKAWYVSGLGWTTINGVQYPTYMIRYAESGDGLSWTTLRGPCIQFKDENEFGFGRPWVIKEEDGYKMWYSIRSRNAPYRMGYAESSDGLVWERRDEEVGIERSAEGWDSQMICYPCVVKARGKRYMFYNGNRHGESGFGYAVLEN
jgi:hypothetical protein